MAIWLQVISRELLMLSILTALGSAPAMLLSERFDPFVRGSLAPVLGLAAGTGLFTTLEWFWPGRSVKWVVPAACACSLALAAFVGYLRRPSGRHAARSRDRSASQPLRSWMQIALVCVAVAMPMTIALGVNHSTGPVAFSVYDSTGYIAETDALEIESLREAAGSGAPATNLVTRFFHGYAEGIQEVDYVPLSAAINPLVGLHSTDTQSNFLIAVLLAGALAMYGAIRHTLRRAYWAACLGGVLFGGSFFMQLFFDGSEAAVAGLALLVPLLVVAYTELPRRRPGGLFVVALMFEGLFSLYPTFVITFGAALAVALLFLACEHFVKTRRAGLREAVWFAVSLLGVGGLAVLLNVVAYRRDFAYWKSLLHGGFVEPNFPQLHFTALSIFGWVLQTRGLYSFAFSSQGLFGDFWPAVFVPVLVALFAVPALRRFRVAWLVLALVPVAGGIGGYQVVHNACGYCEDRSLLPITPAVVYLVALGLGLTFVNARRVYRWLGFGAGGLFAVLAGLSAWRSYDQFSTQSYFLTTSVRSVLAAAPHNGSTVLLEGFGEGPKAPAEEAFVYEMANEETGGHLSMAADVDDREGLAYLGTSPLAPPIYTSNYSYVLTRVPGIATRREVVAGAPGVALERRRRGPDVSLDYGAAVSLMPAQDPGGLAWVIGPLQLVVAGGGGAPGHVTARFLLPTFATVVPPEKGIVFTRSGLNLQACIPTTVSGAARVAEINLPVVAMRIVAMTAGDGRCR
jgi:hypothetical protein